MHTQRLQQSEECIKSWEQAIKALPEKNLTPAERKQKEQYEGELKAAKGNKPIVYKASDAGEMPWVRALALKPALAARVQAGDMTAAASSAWVILAAYEVGCFFVLPCASLS